MPISANIQSAIAPPIPGNYWQWREQSIYYVQAGEKHSARPPLLLVHGFGASTDHWRKNIAELQNHFEVWAIDLLGFGRAAKPAWEYSGHLWQEQLHDFITEVIGKPVIIAGNSLGGYAALCTAAQYPESVQGLILINSAGPFTRTEPTPELPPLQKFLGDAARQLFRQPWASSLLFQYARQRSIIRKNLQKVYLDQSAVTDQLVEEIYRPSEDSGAAQVFASVFTTPPGEKVDILLAKLRCPLLMLWGVGDPWMRAKEQGIKYRQYYPQLTEHYLSAGHCPHDEIPSQVNALIRDWVFETSAPIFSKNGN